MFESLKGLRRQIVSTLRIYSKHAKRQVERTNGRRRHKERQKETEREDKEQCPHQIHGSKSTLDHVCIWLGLGFGNYGTSADGIQS